ncbi:ribosome small subunit-dependent GTPase A [Arsenicicoccus bolidensis]|uniref:Small ribosomal subunit biogenesis GTPase RsgA n=1 Tax=Arsenicicoccus bolidensis TaxID=229480 RepID=A0ABS9Q3L0_9MICO|nr:ribosome small subunit-dependent GTPase A [Arsenicicoccus bolidensis]MCG7321897.1 ribosome small subunit-dependent GTPase A [Arsenicicoccus bolidensis]
MSRRSYDESDVRVRPNRRGSRPRTKDRPAHEDAVEALVTAVDRGRYTTLLGEGTADERVVTAMKARELGRKGIVVGDRVGLVGDLQGGPDHLARIVRQHERRSVLRRTADDTDPVERIIVANVDQLVVVTALANPEPRPRMIDRCLVAAYDAGLEPILVLTKADLVDPTPLVEAYAPLGARCIATSTLSDTEVLAGASPEDVLARTTGLDELRDALTGQVSVMVGHSGVGKSTLVNLLVPDAMRATGHVNDHTGRGRHTSTSAIALRLPDASGWVVDTPGVRSFGLAHVRLDRIVALFPDLEPGTADCPRGCTHDEEECGLDAWVASGQAGPAGVARLDSLRRLLRARSAGEDT